MTLITFVLLVLFFIFMVGLCIGSFLNVVILRAFTNESIVLPPSKCPKCNTKLKWYHNIPILSYLFLRGKCAFCKEPISKQYPIIELITGLLFVAVFIQFGITLPSIFIFAIVSIFVVIAATDIKEKVVFDFHTYALLIVGLIFSMFNFGHLYVGDHIIKLGQLSIVINNSLIASLLGILLAIVIMEAFARFGYLVAGTRAFGEGDTYIAAGLGAIFGWHYLLTVLVYAFILQIVITLPLFLKKLFVAKDYITLGAFFAFLGVIIIMKWIDYAMITNNVWIYGILTVLLVGLGIYLCVRILRGLKDPQKMTFLPFGPSLVIGGLLAIFLLVR